MTRERARIAAVLLLALGAPQLGAQSAVDSVRSLDRAWARAYAVHDTATVQALFAPTIVVTNSIGAPKTRDQELADVRPTPGLVMNYFRTENVDVHVTPRDAVVVGNAVWEFVMNGQTRNLRRRYTTTYARGGSLGSQMVALHLFSEPPVAAPPSQLAPTGVEGRWEGALGRAAGRLRLVLELSKAPDGLMLGTLTSIDQGGSRFPIDVARQTGDSIHLEWRSIGAAYRGTISADRMRLTGTWSQAGQSSPSSGAVAATSTTAPPAAPTPFGILADVSTPMAPTPFTTDGRTYLVYEVHSTNFSGTEILLSRRKGCPI